VPATTNYVTDKSGVGPFTRAELSAKILAGDTLSFMGVPPVSARRMGLDRDLNGTLDGDEPLPALTATWSDLDILISWPTNTMGTVLESTESLSSPDWRAETSVQTVDIDRFRVNVLMTNQNRFYRLRGL